MHWSSILFLKKGKQNLYEKLPSNLKIAKLSVSYSNYFFNLFFNNLHVNIGEVSFFSTFPDSYFPKIIK